ncbi:hypothetical protein LT17_06451 [Pseudomonas aeruginosa]|uniref:hypothetical protein n=1 Tax=Pseudomonas aeruginosa TaxID=287 RepID=UPI000799C90D|nr:hypothetical protein [Pseudomonas aeruginosa]KXG12279.1 hypothetical protein LT17_06451 [Pseudomonas aeruginosa]RTR66208.1 hypothetical protein DY930_31840 [Pseudomonas aeruginosa]HCL3268258.1 hypothetical protein [Pseudomonas aeruginosa]
MTIAINDRLQKTLNGLNVDSRLSTWLWFFLKGQAPHANLGEIGSPGMRDRMAYLIQNTQTGAEFVETQSALHLLPAKDLEWITSNKRQNLFVVRKLIEKNGNLPIIGQTSLTGRALTIAMIDIWRVEISQKIWLINQIKFEWEQHSSSDHIFKWFDSSDTKQRLETAWEIAKRKYPILTFQQNIPQEKDEFITLLDSHPITTPEKILLMDSIKKRWSQNKYRAKLAGKKQYNFILSEKAIQRLDKLAEKHDLRRTEVLEILLKMEEEKGNYIPEKLNPLKDL